MRFPALLAALLLAAACALAADPYRTLGLKQGAGEADVKRAYRQLALKLHPDKNPSAAAKERWLRVQQAYEELMERGSSGGADPFTRRYRDHQRQEAEAEAARAAEAARRRSFWQAASDRRQGAIPSDSVPLDSGGKFNRLVLSPEERPGGTPWLVQLFSHTSPYCRALSGEWEAAAGAMSGLVFFGRVDYSEQTMLVRFLASHLRLFHTTQPWRELPVAIGFPRGCYAMSCAKVFGGQFTSAALQQFAAARLLRLPRLPPLSAWMLGAWCRAVPDGRVGVLALLREGQAQPLTLLDAVLKAQGRVAAAAAVWRKADKALWASLANAAAPPALLFCKGPASQRHLVTVPASALGSAAAWGTEVKRHASEGRQRASAPALALSRVLLAAMHGVSRVEALGRALAEGVRVIVALVGWRQLAIVGLFVLAVWSLQLTLRLLSELGDDEYIDEASPEKAGGRRVREMQREDWEPTPGRFLVLLPLPAGQGDGRDAQHKAAEAAQERLEALAAVFQRERRLLFRTVPISDTLAKLLPAAADAAAANGSSGGGGDSGSSKDAAEGSNGAAPAAEKQPAAAAQPAALVLHPRRGRFQALPLGHMQSAVLRLEDLLDGYGEWREAAPS